MAEVFVVGAAWVIGVMLAWVFLYWAVRAGVTHALRQVQAERSDTPNQAATRKSAMDMGA